jgi:hypothetical protein
VGIHRGATRGSALADFADLELEKNNRVSCPEGDILMRSEYLCCVDGNTISPDPGRQIVTAISLT